MHQSWKPWFALLGSVLILAGFATVKAWFPSHSPVGFGIQSYTNSCAVVIVTNLTRESLKYIVKVEHKVAKGWPVYQAGFPVGIDYGQDGTLPPRGSTNLTLQVLTYAPPCPWRVSVFCCWNAPGPNTMRFKAGLRLFSLHMPKLA